MESLPRVVVFDLDDTLLDHRFAERSALADVYTSFGEHFGNHSLAHVQQVYHEVNVPLWRDFGAGLINASDVKHLRSSRLLDALHIRGLDSESFSDTYLDRYSAHWSWIDGASSAFDRIADAFPVGLLTNGFSAQQRGKLARFPELEARSSFTVISEEVGAMKPTPAIFEHTTHEASRALGESIAPPQILYVGDSFHSDVEGGVGFGWNVAWFRGQPEQAPAGVMTFDDWNVLLDSLDLKSKLAEEDADGGRVEQDR